MLYISKLSAILKRLGRLRRRCAGGSAPACGCSRRPAGPGRSRRSTGRESARSAGSRVTAYTAVTAFEKLVEVAVVPLGAVVVALGVAGRDEKVLKERLVLRRPA